VFKSNRAEIKYVPFEAGELEEDEPVEGPLAQAREAEKRQTTATQIVLEAKTRNGKQTLI
jgi:hypothetical protein